MNASKSLAWSMIGQLMAMACTMAGSIAMARLLTPAQNGAFTFSVVMFALVQSLLQLGMANYVLREASLSHERLGSVTTLVLLQGIVASLVMALLSPVAALYSGHREVGWLVLAVAFVPILATPEGVCVAMWSRERRFRRIALLQIAKAAAQTIVSIVTALLGWGAFALAAGLIANGVMSFIAAIGDLIIHRRVPIGLSGPEWRHLRGFGTHSMVLMVITVVNGRLPELVLGRAFGIGPLGQYSRAFGTVDLFLKTVSVPVARVFAPRTMQRVNDGQPLREGVIDLYDVFTFFLWPALAGLAVLSTPVVNLLYGPQWDIAGNILGIICLTAALDAARSGSMEALLMRDRLDLNNRIEAARLIIGLTLFGATLPFGFTAALWSRVAEGAIAMLLYAWALRRIDAFPGALYVRVVLRNLLLSALAIAPALMLMTVRGWPRTLPPVELFGSIGCGIMLWLGALAVLRHPYMRAGLQLIGTGRIAAS